MPYESKVLGITGGVGAGKSTVLEYLHDKYGAYLIRCDDVAREIQESPGPCFEELSALLTPYDCIRGGKLDRQQTAKVLFADPALLQRVNDIVHPAVREEVDRRIALYKRSVPLIVIEAALLIQAGYASICDEIWFVYADRETRAARLENSRGYSAGRIHSMFEAQPEDVFFQEHSQLMIDNSSDRVQNTYEQIDRGLMEHGLLQHSQREQR